MVEKVLAMAKVTPKLECRGGLGDGRKCSQAELQGRSRQLLRLFPSGAKGEVLAMVEITFEPACQGGLNDG